MTGRRSGIQRNGGIRVGIQAAIRELEKSAGSYPTILVRFPALLPMDQDYDEANP